MSSMSRHVVFGALAALCTTIVGLDASLFRPSEYPLAHKLFDGDWQIFRNLWLMVFTGLAALFGYLALNIKNGTPT